MKKPSPETQVRRLTAEVASLTRINQSLERELDQCKEKLIKALGNQLAKEIEVREWRVRCDKLIDGIARKGTP